MRRAGSGVTVTLARVGAVFAMRTLARARGLVAMPSLASTSTVQVSPSVVALAGRVPEVLAADTTVCLGRHIFGKPADADDAVRMLRELAGKEHQVLTAVALHTQHGVHSALSRNRVRLASLSEREIQAYVDTGEPMGKAGAYGVQGAAAAYISQIKGSYTGIMGLPLFETAQLLKQI